MPNLITLYLQRIETHAHLLAIAVPVEKLTEEDLDKILTVSVLLRDLVQKHIPALREPVQCQVEENPDA